MQNVVIDEAALTSMQTLLGEHFESTLLFCHSEFDRLHQELAEHFDIDQETAVRNAHSLKSNAAQFGAVSLAEIARQIEHLLGGSESNQARVYLEQLAPHISSTKEKMTSWLVTQ